jgi:hypothetical protein
VKAVKWIVGLLILAAMGFGFTEYYSFIFARRVAGVIVDVQKVEMNTAIVTRTAGDASYLHSFAIAVKEPSGEIVTASTEDRQWAVVKAGQCVEAKYFPYPPWDLKKAGTYFGARLLKLSECAAKQ